MYQGFLGVKQMAHFVSSVMLSARIIDIQFCAIEKLKHPIVKSG